MKLRTISISLMFLAAAVIWSSYVALAAPEDVIVGNGTPESCDNNALGAAVANGGTITFNCGAAPHTIIADTYVIATDTVIDGGGLITLDGENLRRIFIVQDNIRLIVRNITLTRGFASDGAGGAIWNFGDLLVQNSTLRENGTDTMFAGGALANFSPGVVTIEDSILEDNTAADGGAIYSYGPAVTVRRSILRNNAQRANGGFYGGGAILQEVNDAALFTIEDSVFQNNRSNPMGAPGGAISFLTGKLVIRNSTFDANLGYGGAGALYIAAGATVEISQSQIRGNHTAAPDESANFLGGGILNNGVLLVEESMVAANEATDGGGIFSGGQGSSLILRGSTVYDNRAAGGGGGMLLFPGAHVIENSTISGNRATIGAGIRSGITAGAGSVLLRHVTLFANEGESLYVDPGSEAVVVQQSILAGATAGGVCNSGAALISGGDNLVSDGSCRLDGPGDRQNIDPLLAPLSDNGGPTLTHLPYAGSPAVDMAGSACLPTDQRGVARPQGAACDAGAVEGAADVPPPACGGMFTAVADAVLDPEHPDAALGGDTQLRLFKQGDTSNAILLRFEPGAALPPDAAVGAAQLELHLPAADQGGVYAVEVRGVAGDWNEASVSWQNRPAPGGGYSSRSYSGADGIVRIDVTELVQAWRSAARPGEIWLQPAGAEAVNAIFAAREQGAGSPRLVLTCVPPAQIAFPDTTAADARQLAGLERLQAASSEPVTIEFGDDGSVRHAGFRLPTPANLNSSHERALWFANAYKDLMRLADPAAQLQLAQYDEGNLNLRYRQLHDGIPVYPAELVVHFDGSDVVGLTGAYLPEVTTLTGPYIDERAASELALAIGGPGSEMGGIPQLRYIVPAALGLDGPLTVLAWQVSLLAPDRSAYLFIDAHSGKLLLEEPRNRDAFFLGLWSGSNSGPSSGSTCWNSIPNEVLWYDQNGQRPNVAPNADGQTAFAVIRSIYNYWLNAVGINRDSYRGNGNQISLYVNVGNPWNNAQFNPTCDILEFGQGRVSQDIVGHEFTHGVVNTTAGLRYQNQSGALDESFSDIFGHFVDNDDWTIGEASGFGAIRDLSNPTRFTVNTAAGLTLPHPDRMSNFITPAQLGNVENNAAAGGDNDGVCEPFETCVVFDSGGVHFNSGIHNKAAYLLVNGGDFNGRTVRAIGQAKAQVLFYRVLSQNRLTANATLLDARNAAVAVAQADAGRFLGLFNADDVCSVRNAYAAVELGLGDADCDGNEDTQGLGSDDDRDTKRLPNDNCPFKYNPGQRDIDGDGVGDACDADMDGDAICNAGGPLVPGAGVAAGGCQPGAMTVNGAPADNCPAAANTNQLNRFGGPAGDVCDDVDEDHVVDALDNCPQLYQWRTEDWRDTDGDGRGDLCDDDLDGDLQPNQLDNCPFVPNYNGRGGNGEDTTETSRGLPADGVGDACDLCPTVSSPDNSDIDGDGLANPCDQDDDNDEVCDVGGPRPGGMDGVPAAGCQPGAGAQGGEPADNCPLKSNRDQTDFDDNGVGFVCDAAEAEWMRGVLDRYGTRIPLPGVGTRIPIPICPQCGGKYLPNRFEQVFNIQVPSGFRAIIRDNFSNVVAQSVQTNVGQVLRYNPAPFALRTGIQRSTAVAEELAPDEILYYLEFIPDETVDPAKTYEMTIDLNETVNSGLWSLYLPAVRR